MAIKDNMCIEGQLTTCSSKILSGFKPTYTAQAVENLKNAGAVILGKTNMDEFAMGSTTETSYYGPTKNPHNTAHVPGGSSGGSCAAVQIGAVISHEAGKKFRCPENDRIMLVAGMAAGFGGLFQTPLAAVFFAMEVIASGYMQYEALLPAMISAYTAAFTSHILGLEKFTAVIGEKLDLSETKVILSLIVLGILFGLVGRLLFFVF